MGLEGKSLCVLAPMYEGTCKFNYHISLGRLIETCTKNNVPMTELVAPKGAILSMVRNELVHYFMHHTKATHALLADTDIGFEAEDILRMLDSEYEVIGAPCTRKSIRWDRVIKAARRAREEDRKLSLVEVNIAAGDPVGIYENPEEVDVYEPQPMTFLGAGILMVKREVFDILQSAFPERWYFSQSTLSAGGAIDVAQGDRKRMQEIFVTKIDRVNRNFLQEDYAFCQECRSCGIMPVMFPWVRTTHFGGHLFVGNLPGMASLTGEV